MRIKSTAVWAAITCLVAAWPLAGADARGQLIVTSRPAGAAVTIDGMAAGHTPAFIDLPSGRYHIGVNGPHHTSAAFEARIVDNLTTRRQVSLGGPAQPRASAHARPAHGRSHPRPAQAPGELRVRSTPAGARVRLDGAFVGVTPLLVAHLGAGRHELSLTRAGHRPASCPVTVHAGLTSTLTLHLGSLPRATGHPIHPVGPAASHARPAAGTPFHRVTSSGHPAHGLAAASPLAGAGVRRDAPTADHRAAGGHGVPARAAAVPAPAAEAVPAMAAPATAVPAGAGGPPALPDDGFDWRVLPFGILLAGLVGALAALGIERHWRFPRVVSEVQLAVIRPRGPRPWPHGAACDDETAFAAAALAAESWDAAAASLALRVAGGRGLAWHYQHWGLALQHLGRFEEAEGAYRTALQLDSSHPDAGFNLATALAAGADWAHAAIALRRHLAAHPADAEAQILLGLAYRTLAMPGEAAEAWAAALKRRPFDRALRRSLARLKADLAAGSLPAQSWHAAPGP